MAKPGPIQSPLDAAEESFLRRMLEIGGDLLGQIATETDSMAILQTLCGSMRDFLDASKVDLVVTADAEELGAQWSVTADDDLADRPSTGTPSVEDPEPSQSCQADITATSGRHLAVLRASWPITSDRPNDIDRAVTERFAAMAFVIIERYLARRRQLQAIARDREMIAGELHDEPIQMMTAVSLRLQKLSRNTADEHQREAVESLRTITDDAIEELRRIMFSLYPETLVEDGLAAAVEAYCETYVEPQGLIVTVEDDEQIELPTELAMIGFRLARNAISNVIRHARASSISITISATDHRLEIHVADDGIGFEVDSVRQTAVGHFGIPHANTMAQWAGGSHTITSEPGRGTIVTILLPTR